MAGLYLALAERWVSGPPERPPRVWRRRATYPRRCFGWGSAERRSAAVFEAPAGVAGFDDVASYSGLLQADAYGGYGRLYEPARTPGPILEAACWVHARRPFFVLADVEEATRPTARSRMPGVISPIALDAVRRIDALFSIERDINGQSAERRRAVRQELSAPMVADLEGWMREQRAKLSRGNDLARAMDYMLKRWEIGRASCRERV